MKKNILLLLLSLLLVWACGRYRSATGMGTDDALRIYRYDKVLTDYVRTNSYSAMQKLMSDYRPQTKILIEEVLEIGSLSEDSIMKKMQSFYSDTTLVRLMHDVNVKFENLAPLEEELGQAFKRLQKEVPGLELPKVYTQISAFNESVVLADSLLGISLDKYMGEDYPIYSRFFYDHQLHAMTAKQIAPDCLAYFLLSRYPLVYDEKTTMIEVLAHYGKVQWVVDKLLEEATSGSSLGYTQEELQWCTNHSKQIWQMMQANGYLQSRNTLLVKHYVQMTPEEEVDGQLLPERVGVWLGQQIVAAYLKKHSNLTIEELLANRNEREMCREFTFE